MITGESGIHAILNMELVEMPAPGNVEFVTGEALLKKKNSNEYIAVYLGLEINIEFALTTGVDMFLKISDEFMQKILDYAPGEYLISDESSLHDFTGLNEWDLTDIRKKIRDVYDRDISDIESGNLLEIFKRIHNKKYGALS
jgi:hypothetical protein